MAKIELSERDLKNLKFVLDQCFALSEVGIAPKMQRVLRNKALNLLNKLFPFDEVEE